MTHSRSIARIRCALVLVPLLAFMCLAGCGSSAVQDLQLVIAGSEAVVAALETVGVIPASVSAAINTYMGQVSAFADFATTELASTDTAAVKASRIAAEAASVAKPDLPGGTPTLLVTSIQAVAQAVATFLANIHTTAALISEPSYGNSFAAAGKPAKINISKADQKKLEALHARAAALKAKFPKK